MPHEKIVIERLQVPEKYHVKYLFGVPIEKFSWKVYLALVHYLAHTIETNRTRHQKDISILAGEENDEPD